MIRGTLIWLGMKFIRLSLVGTGKKGGVVIWGEGERIYVTRSSAGRDRSGGGRDAGDGEVS